MRAFRIVVAGHGPLPAALLATTELIVGPLSDIVTAGLAPDQSPDAYAEALRAAIGHDGRRVLVICDLLGGTPFNVASAIARRSSRIVCLAGFNLAVAIEAVMAVGELDDVLIERLLEAGRSGIVETQRHRAQRAS